MAVKIGHASISENGTIKGNAGDQTGREVCTRSWYKHSKGWVTLEFKDPKLAEYAAEAMEKACKNNDIGYDQYQNGTLWNNVEPYGWDPSKTTKKVETDCARLVRVCVQYAVNKSGLNTVIPDFNTATMVSVLMKTGFFKKHTDSKYNAQDKYLRRGMIQTTCTKGHTWIILENGSKASVTPVPDVVYNLGDRYLRNGSSGNDVKEMQSLLIQMGYDLGSWGADGDFGDMTEMAVRDFQKDKGLEVDGIVGEKTVAALLEGNDALPENPKIVEIKCGNGYIRSKPDTSGDILGVAYKGEKLAYLGETSETGWQKLRKGDVEGYVSGKYAYLAG